MLSASPARRAERCSAQQASRNAESARERSREIAGADAGCTVDAAVRCETSVADSPMPLMLRGSDRQDYTSRSRLASGGALICRSVGVSRYGA